MSQHPFEKLVFPDMISISQSIIRHWYNGTLSQMSVWLDPNIIWVDSTISHCFYNSGKLLTNSPHLPARNTMEIQHFPYHQRSSHPETGIITGQYKVTPKTGRRSGLFRTYQITLIWAECRREPKLIHVHISSCASPTAPSNILSFPGKKSETHRIFPDEILYIEAENINCRIYTVEQPLCINLPMGRLAQQLPVQFLRVHRSFIVNRMYVSRVYRYSLELSNHIIIPIPEKKYMEVVCEIENPSIGKE